MFISIEGPTASGKTTIARWLQAHYMTEDYPVIIIDDPNVSKRFLEKIIMPILMDEGKGVIIADCLNSDMNGTITIKNWIAVPDVILRTQRKDNPIQAFVSVENSLNELLEIIPTF